MVILKRNYDIYVSKAPNASADSTNTVKLLVKDFSFNRPSILTNVGRETLDPLQERTIVPYPTTIAPVTFSLITYILPLVDTNVTSPEEYLWTSLMGSDTIAGTPNSTPTSSTIDFSEGNVGTLQELTLWFDIPGNTQGNYRIDNAIIDSATINFDINGIAEIEWSGRALDMSRDNSPPVSFTDRTNVTSYLKNKISTLSLSADSTYTLALTGGSITFENNNIFHGRNKLGLVAVPEGHYTGNREISGDLGVYFKSGSLEGAALHGNFEFDFGSTSFDGNYDADITINIGGTTAPYIQVNVPRAILEIPRLQFDEIISMDVPFTAKEGTGFYSSVIYYA